MPIFLSKVVLRGTSFWSLHHENKVFFINSVQAEVLLQAGFPLLTPDGQGTTGGPISQSMLKILLDTPGVDFSEDLLMLLSSIPSGVEDPHDDSDH
jgi:hypothetical protein